MNTVRRVTVLFVAVTAACVVGAGTASAAPHPEPEQAQVTVTSNNAEDQARQRLAHQLYVDRGQDELAEEAAAAARSRVAEEHPAAGIGVLSGSGRASTTAAASKQSSGNDLEVPLLAVTALAGLALGAAGSTASRRLRGFESRRVGQGVS